MFTGQVKVTQWWTTVLLVVGLCSMATAQGLTLPYSGSKEYKGQEALFEITNTDDGVDVVIQGQPAPSGEMWGILGRYSYVPKNPVDIPSSYNNVGILGGQDFGIKGICRKADGYAIVAESTAGIGLYAKGRPRGCAAVFDGHIVLGNRDLPLDMWRGKYMYDGLGFWGTQGAWRSSWTWNYHRRAEDNLINILGLNGYSNVTGIELGNDGILLRAQENSSNGDPHPAPRMVIKPNGNVGIGKNNPSAKLDVAGDLKVEGAYSGDIGPNGGAPFPRPAYDSGWLKFEMDDEKNRKVIHNIGGNVDNYVIDLQMRSSKGITNESIGGMIDRYCRCHTHRTLKRDIYHPTVETTHGAYWHSLTTKSITVCNFSLVPSVCDIRIRIWVYN